MLGLDVAQSARKEGLLELICIAGALFSCKKASFTNSNKRRVPISARPVNLVLGLSFG